MFFFNPSTKTSLWERPKDLEGNERVDEILRQGPKIKPKQPSPQPTKEVTAVKDKPIEVVADKSIEKGKEEKVAEPESKKKK